MQPTSWEAIYDVQQEKIGPPDPTAPGYVGTYTPPGTYKVREGGRRDGFGQPENANSRPLLGHFEKHWKNHGRNIQTDSQGNGTANADR